MPKGILPSASVAEGYACVLHRLLRGAGFANGKAKRPQCDSMPYPTYVSFISVVRKTRKPEHYSVLHLTSDFDVFYHK